jgi:MFS family permease
MSDGADNLASSCSLQPMTGKIYSRFDSKYTFMFFLGLFELGSLLSAVATSSKMFIVGRAVAGMGGSGLVNGALTIIACCIPMEKRALHMGIMMGTAQLGIMFGPLVGGALTEYASWRCRYWGRNPFPILDNFMVFSSVTSPKTFLSR